MTSPDSPTSNDMTTTPLKLGFIGLGIMGAPMAQHLIAAGHQLFVFTLGKMPAEIAASGATQCTNARGVAERADIVFLMVPDTPDVAAALFDETGVASGLTKGKTVVDMSSISPLETKAFAKRINALGCDYLDAPVSGGEVGAKAASLTIMVGGPQSAFDRVKPLFELMGKNITQVWPSPLPPTSVMFLPISDNSGFRRSKVASSPPHMMVRLAALAPTSPPDTGASR